MDGVTIRNARSTEADSVVRFWSRAGENAARPADHRDVVVQLIERDPGALIVADLGGRLVGTIIAGWDGWRANLYRLAVDPELRGRGLGGRILDVAESRLRGLGAQRYCAMVLSDNDLGRRLWASAGYVQQEDWRRWVKSPI